MSRPAFGGQQVVLDCPIVTAASDPDVAASQTLTQRGQHCRFVKTPVRRAVREDQLAPLIRHIGHGPDDWKHAVELLHADLAFDYCDAVLTGFLRVAERGDGAAEQDERPGDIASRGLKTSLAAVPRPAEQGAHVFLEHGERRVGQPDFRAGCLNREDRVRRAGPRSAMCWTVMIAPSSISRARRAAWMRPARGGSTFSPRAYSRRSSGATMLEARATPNNPAVR